MIKKRTMKRISTLDQAIVSQAIAAATGRPVRSLEFTKSGDAIATLDEDRFSEDKHKRADDGKFTSGSGGGGSGGGGSGGGSDDGGGAPDDDGGFGGGGELTGDDRADAVTKLSSASDDMKREFLSIEAGMADDEIDDVLESGGFDEAVEDVMFEVDEDTVAALVENYGGGGGGGGGDGDGGSGGGEDRLDAGVADSIKDVIPDMSRDELIDFAGGDNQALRDAVDGMGDDELRGYAAGIADYVQDDHAAATLEKYNSSRAGDGGDDGAPDDYAVAEEAGYDTTEMDEEEIKEVAEAARSESSARDDAPDDYAAAEEAGYDTTEMDEEEVQQVAATSRAEKKLFEGGGMAAYEFAESNGFDTTEADEDEIFDFARSKLKNMSTDELNKLAGG